MSLGRVDKFRLQDISIIDLVLDDLAGYRDMLKSIDENIIDRRASIVLHKVYRTESNIPEEDDIPFAVKQWVAAHTVLDLIPALRTYIAKYEIRSDTSDEGSIGRYDQLDMLDDLQVAVQNRIIEMKAEVQIALEDDFAIGPRLYDLPGVSNSSKTPGFATLDPWRIGIKMFENE